MPFSVLLSRGMPVALVERFEDLVAWQKARLFANDVFNASRGQSFRKDFGLNDQINRSALSVTANIAEGFDRGSRAEFARFLVIAKGSCAETRSHLYMAQDRGYLSAAEAGVLLNHAEEVARIVTALLAAVRRQQRSAERPTPF